MSRHPPNGRAVVQKVQRFAVQKPSLFRNRSYM